MESPPIWETVYYKYSRLLDTNIIYDIRTGPTTAIF
ncbi:hypothetical protein SASC598O11_007050 [Snodgrassella alvi SCGC AB-598-O11]|nr:hypothetical protein SASC598O11_007050 [Snodgrassella alvi SCGC AB-598-O11]